MGAGGDHHEGHEVHEEFRETIRLMLSFQKRKPDFVMTRWIRTVYSSRPAGSSFSASRQADTL
jgi:hypothetical protein